MQKGSLWERFKQNLFEDRVLGFSLDLSRVNYPDGFIEQQKKKLLDVFTHIAQLEAGSIANPDENRMVGHYWLRNPQLAPSKEIRSQIQDTLQSTTQLANKILSGEILSAKKQKFKYALIVGIGGSALGPQFVNQALSTSQDPIKLYFFDNTDPDGMQRTLNLIPALAECLTIVISKSGGTKETRNGMLVAEAAYKSENIDFPSQAVAITGEGSELDKYASANKWLARLPMFDWIGGRTSQLSAVGLFPAALQGADIKALLQGASQMDELTRSFEYEKNPAAQLAIAWQVLTNAKGEKDMVVLPYNDRLELFSRYLQQLVMESLGKEKDLSGKIVNQGIAVYGNKGSTDQHAYVQQLRDGVNNFFALFIRVLSDKSPCLVNRLSFSSSDLEVEPNVTCGDYLSGFYQGTREALYQNGRQSITISIDKVDAHSVGMLIAIFERAVSIYARLVGINAYHQPGVEAGKKAATEVLKQQSAVIAFLNENKGKSLSLEEIADKIGRDHIESIFLILQHLAANNRIKMHNSESGSLSAKYKAYPG